MHSSLGRGKGEGSMWNGGSGRAGRKSGVLLGIPTLMSLFLLGMALSEETYLGWEGWDAFKFWGMVGGGEGCLHQGWGPKGKF